MIEIRESMGFVGLTITRTGLLGRWFPATTLYVKRAFDTQWFEMSEDGPRQCGAGECVRLERKYNEREMTGAMSA